MNDTNHQQKMSSDWKIPVYKGEKAEKKHVCNVHGCGNCIPLKLEPIGMGEPTREIQSDGRVLLTWRQESQGVSMTLTGYE